MWVNVKRVFGIWITLVVMITFCCGSGVTASAGNPPVPDFTLSADNGYVPLTVTMTDTSTGNPDSWSWTIDDYLHKTGKGPFTISFNKPGTHLIGLVVENQYGSSFKEKTVLVYSTASPLQTCIITASPDKTTLGWGESVTFTGTAYGCLGTTKIPVIVRVRGPNLPATGLDLTRDLDYVTSPPDTNEAFPFTWYTGHAFLNNFLTYGVYTITFVDGTGAEYSPVKLDFSKQPLCYLKATADKSQYLWGEQVHITGNAIDCPSGIKVKIGSAPNGPVIAGVTPAPYGSGIPEGFDLATGQPGADSAFSFTFDTKPLQQQYALKDGPYILYILNMKQEDQYSKIPLHLGVLGSTICSISIDNVGNYENSWGDKVTFKGIAENCPGGVRFILVSTSTLLKSIPPTGIDIGTAQPGSDLWYFWTWDSGLTQQKNSLQDGVYEVYAMNVPGYQYEKVNVKMVNANTGSSGTVGCSHWIHVYEGQYGDRHTKGPAGIVARTFGSQSAMTYLSANQVDTASTGADGVMILHIPASAVTQWQYFHTGIETPAGYGWGGIRQGNGQLDQMGVKTSEFCNTFTEFWITPPTGPIGTVTPQRTIETPIPEGTLAPVRNSGEESPSFFNYIISLPRMVISFVQGSPAPDTQTTESVQATGSVSVIDIPEGSTADARAGSMHVVVLPERDDLRMKTILDADKIVPDIPPALPGPQVVIIQEHMIAGPENTPGVTPSSSPEPRAIIPENYIGSKPQILPIKFACPAGYNTCNGQCVDLMTDTAYCGSCNSTCPSQFTCVAGMCNPQCNSDQILCNKVCANLLTDPANCGTCRNICTNGAACENGQCVLPSVKIRTTRLGDIGKVRF